MMKKITLIFMLLTTISCGKKVDSLPVTSAQLEEFNLRHHRVKELFLMIFEKDYSADEWKTVFELTKILSANKKVLRLIEGDDSDSASAIRMPIISKNAEILGELSQKSVFMLSWSAQDENCKITQREQLLFTCKPRNKNNPLNGGLPTVTESLQWLNPDPIREEIKTPYLRMIMRKEASSENLQKYSIELRLKIEKISDSESWFKGEAIPLPESKFLKSSGGLTNDFFKYGYAEMTLGN
jgi:hypothetical protein